MERKEYLLPYVELAWAQYSRSSNLAIHISLYHGHGIHVQMVVEDESIEFSNFLTYGGRIQ